MSNEQNVPAPAVEQPAAEQAVVDYWLGAFNERFGIAIMRKAPGEDSRMVANVMMRKDVAERVGWAIIRELEAVDAGK